MDTNFQRNYLQYFWKHKIFICLQKYCDSEIFCNISIAMKDWKYFWHVSAIFCAMWGERKLFEHQVLGHTSILQGNHFDNRTWRVSSRSARSHLGTHLNTGIYLAFTSAGICLVNEHFWHHLCELVSTEWGINEGWTRVAIRFISSSLARLFLGRAGLGDRSPLTCPPYEI